MEIIPFAPEYAREAAEIHMEGQPGTLLSNLGLDFLTRLYTAMAESPLAFGYGAVDEGKLVGVGMVAIDTDRMFGDIKRHYWHRLVWPVAKQIVRHPKLIGDILDSFRYPSVLAAEPDEAEMLFLGIRRAYMRQGVAMKIIEPMLAETYERGCLKAVAVADKRNRPIRWTVGSIPGVYVDGEIKLHGTTMVVFRMDMPYQPTKKDPSPTPEKQQVGDCTNKNNETDLSKSTN